MSENGAYPGCWGPELLDKPISKCPCLELLGILCFHEAEISNKYAEVYHAKHHLSNISTYSMYIAYVYIHQYRYIYIYIHTYVSGWLYRYLYYIKMIKKIVMMIRNIRKSNHHNNHHSHNGNNRNNSTNNNIITNI